jgi:CRP-like cAMP-binding protein
MTVRTPENSLLVELLRDHPDALASHLERLTVETRQILHEEGQRPHHLYFPTTALVALLNPLSAGHEVQTASIGREGLVSLEPLLGEEIPHSKYQVIVPGEVVRLETSVLERLLPRSARFQQLLFRYTAALLGQLSQCCACSLLHSVEQRCCRWLLLTSDWTNRETFPLTHELLSQMLGVRRASVTEVASSLQGRGWIRYRRGEMTILDPAGLEAAGCECYRAIKKKYEILRR